MLLDFIVFFFKQKTAYEMRISDWSSDVCSSDLYRSLVSALRAASDDATPDALEELAAALEGVRGLPFEGTKRGWEWIFSEGLSAHITSVVSEAAHLLATQAIERGDPKQDRKSTRLNSSH